MSDIFIAILIAIGGAIAGALILGGANRLYWVYREKRGRWKGQWEATIPASDEEPDERHDQWLFHERRGTITARIVRDRPEKQRGAEWKFVGQEREAELFGVYQSTDPASQSYGGIMLKHTGYGKYKGFYLRLREREIQPTPIVLQIKSPSS